MITVEVTPVSTELNITTSVIEVSAEGPTTVVEVSSGIPRLDLSLDDDLAAGDLTADGVLVTMTAAENLSFGDVCYFAGSSKWAKSSATSASTARATAMAVETIAADTSGNFLLVGFARDDSWSWTPGTELYLSPTSGEMTHTPPTSTNSITQLLGLAVATDRVYFNPSLDIITHA